MDTYFLNYDKFLFWPHMRNKSKKFYVIISKILTRKGELFFKRLKGKINNLNLRYVITDHNRNLLIDLDF
jgi:hypothetical protein